MSQVEQCRDTLAKSDSLVRKYQFARNNRASLSLFSMVATLGGVFLN
jgi:hypothetical protein